MSTKNCSNNDDYYGQTRCIISTMSDDGNGFCCWYRELYEGKWEMQNSFGTVLYMEQNWHYNDIIASDPCEATTELTAANVYAHVLDLSVPCMFDTCMTAEEYYNIHQLWMTDLDDWDL